MELERALLALQPLPPALANTLDDIKRNNQHIQQLEHALRSLHNYTHHTDPALLRHNIDSLAELNATLGRRAYDLIDQHICTLDNELARREAQLRERYKSVPPGPITAEYARERRSREGIWELKEQEDNSRRSSIVSVASEPDVEFPFDPNEPTYCVCLRPSFGQMIQCDNDDCSIEWFHMECVGLSSLPRGKWYCASCKQ
jgi:inhibitor of growth protein 4